MMSVLTAFAGSGLAELRQACGAGDARLARFVLRSGSGTQAPPTVWDPAMFDWPPIWFAVTRMSESRNQASALPVLLDAMHYSGSPISVVVSRSADQTAVHLGFPSTDAAAWAQRVLAPDVLLAPAAADLSSCTLPAWLGVRFRPAPVAERQSAEPGPPPLTLLDRLTAVEEGSWAVRLHCLPVPMRYLQDAVTELTTMSGQISADAQITTMLDEVTHAQRTNPEAEYVLSWIAALSDELDRMSSGGAWHAQTWIHADSELTAHGLAAALTADGPQDPRGPTRTWLSDVALADGQPGPLPMAGVLSSGQIATWLFPPRSSRGGLSVGAELPPGRSALPMRREIRLGTWLGTPDLASVDVDDLSGHGFVAGVTGSGKSTTLLRLLLSLWNVHRIPFLILDPVKEDYRELSGLFTGGMCILRGSDLRLNALKPRPGTDPDVHLDQVGAAFKGAFSMPSPIPYVVSLLLDELRPAVQRDERLTLHDLRRNVRPLIGRLGYRGELEGNILASLETRLAILTAPHRAERFCADEDNIAELFDRPTVVTLADLGDDEERAFVMALLMIYVAQNARGLGTHPQVRHVTVIEEAHRLVGQPSTSAASADSGDAAGYAARLVAQLLAEIRSYGESILLLDQSPAAVAREVVRNTNTKILHRILDPEDRVLVAGAVGLDQSSADFLADLGPGQALIAHVRLPRPQLIQVAPPPPAAPAQLLTAPAPAGRPCCGDDTARHHRAQRVAEEAMHIVVTALAGCVVRPLRDRISVTLSAAQQLSQLGVRADLPDASCLCQIGVRAAAQEWIDAGWLDRAGLEEFVAEVAGCLSEGGMGPIALPPVAAAPIRPYQGCDSCGHACSVRPIARTHPGLSSIRDAVARRGEAAAAEAADGYRTRLSLQYLPILDTAAADDAARCIVLHAVGDQTGTGPE